MDSAYPQAIAFTLAHEGKVYENVPGDPGGPTIWGVTWKDADAYLKEHGRPVLLSPEGVKDFAEADIMAVYKEHYWNPLQCSRMPTPVDIVLFDTGVNVGIGRAVKFLQASLGIPQDGSPVADALAAVTLYNQKHGANPLAYAILTRRSAYYTNLAAEHPALAKFLTGWINRCNDLHALIGS